MLFRSLPYAPCELNIDMPQIFYLSGIACLSIALLFNLLTTISIPSAPGIDVVRVHLNGNGLTEIRVRHLYLPIVSALMAESSLARNLVRLVFAWPTSS